MKLELSREEISLIQDCLYNESERIVEYGDQPELGDECERINDKIHNQVIHQLGLRQSTSSSEE